MAAVPRPLALVGDESRLLATATAGPSNIVRVGETQARGSLCCKRYGRHAPPLALRLRRCRIPALEVPGLRVRNWRRSCDGAIEIIATPIDVIGGHARSLLKLLSIAAPE